MEPWWTTIGNTFGVATMILVAVGYGTYKGSGWLAKEIILPVRDKLIGRLLDFVDKLESTVEEVKVNIITVNTVLAQHSKSLAAIEERISKKEEKKV